jgi:nucleoside 2-deoxyribosyltransferase
METIKIYLSGSMSGVSLEEQTKWRRKVVDAIKHGYEHEKKATFFNPVDHYNFEERQHKTEKEIMEYDLYNLRNSNLVIVNFNNIWSIGTAMELMLAKEMHIPVIGWNSSGEDLHPWLAECTTRLCDNLRETVEHVVNFYLN